MNPLDTTLREREREREADRETGLQHSGSFGLQTLQGYLAAVVIQDLSQTQLVACVSLLESSAVVLAVLFLSHDQMLDLACRRLPASIVLSCLRHGRSAGASQS